MNTMLPKQMHPRSRKRHSICRQMTFMTSSSQREPWTPPRMLPCQHRRRLCHRRCSRFHRHQRRTSGLLGLRRLRPWLRPWLRRQFHRPCGNLWTRRRRPMPFTRCRAPCYAVLEASESSVAQRRVPKGCLREGLKVPPSLLDSLPTRLPTHLGRNREETKHPRQMRPTKSRIVCSGRCSACRTSMRFF